MKAILYARFSPRPNAAECESCDHQLADLRAYAQANGFEVVGEYRDDATSGADDVEDRIGLFDALAACKRGMALLIRSWDRLFRVSEKGSTLVAQLRARGVEVRSISQAGSGDPMINKLLEYMFMWLAEFERETVRSRTRAAMRRHQANGRRMSDRVPFGYRRRADQPSMLEKDGDEQKLIRMMCALWNRGMNLRKICRHLEKHGHACRGRSTWHHSTIKDALVRAGLYLPQGRRGRPDDRDTADSQSTHTALPPQDPTPCTCSSAP